MSSFRRLGLSFFYGWPGGERADSPYVAKSHLGYNAGVGIAFFDLDNTLLAANSAKEWLKRELKQGAYLTRWQALRAGVRLVQYSLGFASLDDAVRRAIAAVAGRDERHVRESTL